jgi:L-lysine exporter family protein LysE/ArgO
VGEEGFATAAVEGFFLGASLIIAIGAQNAFVLRQGLVRRYVFAVALTCFLSDAVLIAAGVAGLGTLVRQAPVALRLVSFAGAAFLAAYGAMAFRRAISPGVLRPADAAAPSFSATLATGLALTWLNPHVYLDTVVLIGGLSARHAPAAAVAFGAGAAVASLVWFFGLAYGARLMAPLFARPAAWRVLDAAIAAVMWMLGARLLVGAVAGG